jgi:hypothetical protein
MGFRRQPNSWQRGPLALKHALLALGTVAEERVPTRASTSCGASRSAISGARGARTWKCCSR